MKGRGKVCFAASSGGHLAELSQLAPIVREGDFVLTEKCGSDQIKWCKKVFYVAEINRRELLFLPKLLWLFIVSFWLLLREKPEAVVSTGALAACPISMLAKKMGKKVVYIESFARIKSASLTGKMLYKKADLFIVQWEEMLRVYPDAIYVGGMF